MRSILLIFAITVVLLVGALLTRLGVSDRPMPGHADPRAKLVHLPLTPSIELEDAWDSCVALWEESTFEDAARCFSALEARGGGATSREAALLAWVRAGRPALALDLADDQVARRPGTREVVRDLRLREGFDLLAQGAAAHSLARAGQVLATHPGDSDALLLQSASQAFSGRPQAARAILQTLVERHPGHTQALALLARIAVENRFPDAARHLDAWAAIDPEAPEIPVLRERLASTATGGPSVTSSRLAVRCRHACAPEMPRKVLEEAERALTAVETRLGRRLIGVASIEILPHGMAPGHGGAPWAVAVWDGEVRLPEELIENAARLQSILRHELVHALVAEASAGRAPAWVHEGLAQWVEGAARPPLPPLTEATWLDSTGMRRTFADLPAERARVAYAFSRLLTDELLLLHGGGGFGKLLDTLAAGGSDDAALRSAFGADFATLSWRVRSQLRPRHLY